MVRLVPLCRSKKLGITYIERLRRVTIHPIEHKQGSVLIFHTNFVKELLFLISNFLVKISNLPSEKQLKYMYILEKFIESSEVVDLKMLKVFLLN